MSCLFYISLVSCGFDGTSGFTTDINQYVSQVLKKDQTMRGIGSVRSRKQFTLRNLIQRTTFLKVKKTLYTLLPVTIETRSDEIYFSWKLELENEEWKIAPCYWPTYVRVVDKLPSWFKISYQSTGERVARVKCKLNIKRCKVKRLITNDDGKKRAVENAILIE